MSIFVFKISIGIDLACLIVSECRPQQDAQTVCHRSNTAAPASNSDCSGISQSHSMVSEPYGLNYSRVARVLQHAYLGTCEFIDTGKYLS